MSLPLVPYDPSAIQPLLRPQPTSGEEWRGEAIRPLFRAVFREHLPTLWPKHHPWPTYSMGRYDAVLYEFAWLWTHQPQILGTLCPVHAGIDMENWVSMLAFDLQAYPNADLSTPSRSFAGRLHLARLRRDEALRALHVDTEADVAEVATGPDGARLVRLVSARAFDREGLRMEHCLRSTLHYFDEAERGDIAILSLRTADDTPQVTVEVNRRATRAPGGLIAQAQGPHNGAFPPGTPVAWLQAQLERLGATGPDRMEPRWAARFKPPANPHAAMLHRADEALDQAFASTRHGQDLTQARLSDLTRTGVEPLRAWSAQRTPDEPQEESGYGWTRRLHLHALSLSVAVSGPTLILRLTLGDPLDPHLVLTDSTWSGLDAQFQRVLSPTPPVSLPPDPLPDTDPRLDEVRPHPPEFDR